MIFFFFNGFLVSLFAINFLGLHASFETDLKPGAISPGADFYSSLWSILTCGIHGTSGVMDQLMYSNENYTPLQMNFLHLLSFPWITEKLEVPSPVWMEEQQSEEEMSLGV